MLSRDGNCLCGGRTDLWANCDSPAMVNASSPRVKTARQSCGIPRQGWRFSRWERRGIAHDSARSGTAVQSEFGKTTVAHCVCTRVHKGSRCGHSMRQGALLGLALLLAVATSMLHVSKALWRCGIQRLGNPSQPCWIRTHAVRWTADGKKLVTGRPDTTLRVWDASSTENTGTLRGHTGTVLSVAVTADGGQIASGSADHTVKVWDFATARELHTFRGHADRVNSVIFSPDGKSVASASDDHTIKLWEVVTGSELQTLRGHAGAVAWRHVSVRTAGSLRVRPGITRQRCGRLRRVANSTR